MPPRSSPIGSNSRPQGSGTAERSEAEARAARLRAEAERRAAEARRQRLAAEKAVREARERQAAAKKAAEDAAKADAKEKQQALAAAREAERAAIKRAQDEAAKAVEKELEANAAHHRAQGAMRVANGRATGKKPFDKELVSTPEPFAVANKLKQHYEQDGVKFTQRSSDETVTLDARSLHRKDHHKLFGVTAVVDTEMTAAEQKRRFGKVVEGKDGRVPPQYLAAEWDAKHIIAGRGPLHSGTTTVAEQGERLVNLLKANHDARYQQALTGMKETQGLVRDMAATVNNGGGQVSRIVRVMSEAAEVGSSARKEKGLPGVGAVLAKEFASQITLKDLNLDEKDKLGGALKASIKDGKGVKFGVELAVELKKANKPEAAREVLKAAHEGVEDLRKDYENAKAKIKEPADLIAQHVGGFGALMPEKDRKQFEKDLRQKHQSKFDAWERAGANYAAALNGLGRVFEVEPELRGIDEDRGGKLAVEAKKALLNVVPGKKDGELSLSATDGGQKAIADALIASSHNNTTFLNRIDQVTQDEDGKLRKAFDAAIVSAATNRVASLTSDWDADKVERQIGSLIRGLEKNGFKQEAPFLSAIAASRTEQKAAQAARSLAGFAQNKYATASTGTYHALAGLGVALGVAGLALNHRSAPWGDAAFADKAMFVAAGSGVGAAGLALFMKSPGAAAVLGKVAPVAAGVIGTIEAGKAASAFKQGHTAEGIGHGMMAAGSLAMLAGLGPGLVGVGIAIGGYMIAAKGKENRQENELKDAFRKQGLSEDQAEHLADMKKGRDAGFYLVQLLEHVNKAKGRDIKPAALWESIKKMTPDEIHELKEMSQKDTNDKRVYKQADLEEGARMLLRYAPELA